MWTPPARPQARAHARAAADGEGEPRAAREGRRARRWEYRQQGSAVDAPKCAGVQQPRPTEEAEARTRPSYADSPVAALLRSDERAPPPRRTQCEGSDADERGRWGRSVARSLSLCQRQPGDGDGTARDADNRVGGDADLVSDECDCRDGKASAEEAAASPVSNDGDATDRTDGTPSTTGAGFAALPPSCDGTSVASERGPAQHLICDAIGARALAAYVAAEVVREMRALRPGDANANTSAGAGECREVRSTDRNAGAGVQTKDSPSGAKAEDAVDAAAAFSGALRRHADELAAQCEWEILTCLRNENAALKRRNAALAENPGRAWVSVQMAAAAETQRVLRAELNAAHEALQAAGVRLDESETMSSLGGSSMGGAGSLSPSNGGTGESGTADAACGDIAPSPEFCSPGTGHRNLDNDGKGAADHDVLPPPSEAQLHAALSLVENARRVQAMRIAVLERRLSEVDAARAAAVARLRALQAAIKCDDAPSVDLGSPHRALLSFASAEMASIASVLNRRDNEAANSTERKTLGNGHVRDRVAGGEQGTGSPMKLATVDEAWSDSELEASVSSESAHEVVESPTLLTPRDHNCDGGEHPANGIALPPPTAKSCVAAAANAATVHGSDSWTSSSSLRGDGTEHHDAYATPASLSWREVMLGAQPREEESAPVFVAPSTGTLMACEDSELDELDSTLAALMTRIADLQGEFDDGAAIMV